MSMKFFGRIALGLAIILFADVQISQCYAQKWHESYKFGLQAMEKGDWNTAIGNFQKALQVKNQDSKKTRAFGTVFIEYFPHREMGICYYNLGNKDLAQQELTLSLRQADSERGRSYLTQIMAGNLPPSQPIQRPTIADPARPATPTNVNRPEPSPVTMVGERLSIAVLPFESKGIGGNLGQIDLLDKLITGFVNVDRFKVIERAQLEKILQEQKLGMTGILDASTAAQIGKGIGVDAVVVGSVTQGMNTVSIDARFIDTETATIITARDAYSSGIGLQNLSQMITDLAAKMKNDLPVVNGYLIKVDGERLTLDIGLKNGIRKGMKCHVYREGAPIVHPVTGEVIGKMIDELCEVQLSDVFDSFSTAVITKTKQGIPQIRDKVITK